VDFALAFTTAGVAVSFFGFRWSSWQWNARFGAAAAVAESQPFVAAYYDALFSPLVHVSTSRIGSVMGINSLADDAKPGRLGPRMARDKKIHLVLGARLRPIRLHVTDDSAFSRLWAIGVARALSSSRERQKARSSLEMPLLALDIDPRSAQADRQHGM